MASKSLHVPVIGVALIAAVVGVVVWKPWKTKEISVPVDPEEIVRLMNQGVGYMENLSSDKNDQAIETFRKVVKLAPENRVGKINLGIALLNTGTAENLDEAIKIFNEILAKDPNDIHAHFNLAMILNHRGQLDEAAPHYEAVTKLDPEDPHAWYLLGYTHPKGRESPQSRECFVKALKLNPYLNAARYSLAMHPVDRDDDKTTAMLAEKEALANATWESEYKIGYTLMGKYADIIGRAERMHQIEAGPMPKFGAEPALDVTLAAGCRWATRDDLAKLPDGAALLKVRDQYGAGLTFLDYDRDGKPDMFLPMAVVDGGKVRNLLLHNEGGKFRDTTKEVGLADSPSCSVVCIGDYDNDSFPDIFLGGPEKQKLYRNKDGKSFVDVSTLAAIDQIKGNCHTALWADLDQDGDLELVLGFNSEKAAGVENGLVILLNMGVAPPTEGKKDQPSATVLPLSTKFKRFEKLPKELAETPVNNVVACDIDGDLDLDLLVFHKGVMTPLYNDRLLRFHTGKEAAVAGKKLITGMSLNMGKGLRSGVVALASDGPPAWCSERNTTGDNSLLAATIEAPRLMQASGTDFDLDGARDVIALAIDDKGATSPVFLHHEGDKLNKHENDFGPADSFPKDLTAIAGVDLDGDGNPDLVYWSQSTGLGWRKNLGNGNKSIQIQVTGTRDLSNHQRTNGDGIGSLISILAGRLFSTVEYSSMSSGPGQSLLPLTLGIGKADRVETALIVWPDCVRQSELDLAAGKLHRIVETNRKTTSCPVISTWDGERFTYVTDCLGAGAIGEITADGSVRPPRPEESIRIEQRQLKAKDGYYKLKMTEPMDEVMYLDRARLSVIEHPVGWKIFPDERFAGEVPATQEFLAFKDWKLPASTKNHRGSDMTAALRDKDGKTVDQFARRSWLGFAENHHVELDFGNVEAKSGERWFLILHGWTDYPYPESIYAATQAGVEMQTPILERMNADGKWERVADIGFPAGLPKTMTYEVTGKLPAKGGKYRISTNLQIYWDQIALAPLVAVLPQQDSGPAASPIPGVTVRHAPLANANMIHRGLIKEVTPAKLTDPVSYDDSQIEKVAVSKWQGKLTRLGDVTELLQATDDRHVLCGPGDEITLSFTANETTLAEGRERTFILRTWGYCKDTAPFTATAGYVGPLPFRAMPKYPYGADVKLPPELVEYNRVWNTRRFGMK